MIIASIYTIFLYMGFVQESIFKNEHEDPFIYPEVIVWFQSWFGYTVAIIGIAIVEKLFPVKEKIDDRKDEEAGGTISRKMKLDFWYGTHFTMAMYFSNYALQYVSYPTQALAKACKPLPVFFSGFFVKGKNYHILDYFSIGFILTGIYLYNYLKSKSGGEDAPIGLVFLVLSLLCNGFSGYYGDQLKNEYEPTNWEYMRSCNLVGVVVLGVHCLLILLTGHYELNYIEYFQRYPGQLTLVLTYGILSAFGQIFIFRTMQLFGALPLAIITCIRKFSTFFMSLIIFAHPITFREIGCVALVIFGVCIDMYVRYFVVKKPPKKEADKTSNSDTKLKTISV